MCDPCPLRRLRPAAFRLTAPPRPPLQAWLAAKPFVNGGLSGIAATCMIQPVDIVKARPAAPAAAAEGASMLRHQASLPAARLRRSFCVAAARAALCLPLRRRRSTHAPPSPHRPSSLLALCSAGSPSDRGRRLPLRAGDRAGEEGGLWGAVRGPVRGRAAPNHVHLLAPGHLQVRPSSQITRCARAARPGAARRPRGALRARARCAGSLPPSTSILSEKLKTYNDGKPVPLYQKAAAGAPRPRAPGARHPLRA